MKRLFLEVNGVSKEALVEKIQGTLWVHLGGKTFSYKPEQQNFGQGRGAASADPNSVFAPMPGKIVKILCAPGDAVEKGQVLVAMEAMKMEYSLKAEKDGRVKDVHCASNDQVQLGDALVILEGDDV